MLVPLFVAHLVIGRRWGGIAKLLAGTAVTVALPLVPFLAIHTTAFTTFWTYHKLRGMHIESIAGAAILLAGKLHWTTVHTVFEFGGDHLRAAWATAVLKWEPAVAAVALAAATVLGHAHMRRAAGRAAAGRALVDAVVCLLLVFVVTNKVFSPQYLVWLAPLVPLMSPATYRWTLAICVLSTGQFLADYARLAHGRLDAVILWNVRNLAVVGLLAWVVREQIVARRNEEAPGVHPGLRSVEPTA